MKTILILILSFIGICASAQRDTAIFNRNMIERHGDAYLFKIYLDTMSGETTPDTIIISGDTISVTDFPDTLVTRFNQVLSSHYLAKITVEVDDIPTEDTLEGTWILFNSPCYACPAETIMNGTIPLSSTHVVDTAEFLDLRIWLRVIATDGTGIIRMWLTLLPF